jgi:hypothetical protein
MKAKKEKTMNIDCGYCGREFDECQKAPCNPEPEPDFERLLELHNDYKLWQRDGDSDRPSES